MKPTNIYKHGCDPISSNCVIWQGPDIECINLCKGDSVSDVVYKLAQELCTLMETFKISNYDLSCFNLAACDPDDFKSLIQLLIDKVCECCNVTPTPQPDGTNGCPDCEVSICSVFYFQNPQGDTVTTMQLTDYVQAIGNRVCELVSEIAAINITLSNHEGRIQNLENGSGSGPGYTPPTVIPCNVINLPQEPTAMDVALQQLLNQYCTLASALGTPTDILGATAFECTGLSQTPQLANPLSNMNTLTGWESAPSSLEDSFRNMWLTICDIRTAIANLKINCCDTGCDTVVVSLSAQRNASTSTTIELFYTGTIPTALQNDCTSGSSVTITDSAGNTITQSNQQLVQYLNGTAGQSIPLAASSISTSLALTIVVDFCVYDPTTAQQCQNQLVTTIGAEGACPTLVVAASTIYPNSGAAYQFSSIAQAPVTYTLEWWDSSLTVLIGSQSIVYGTQGQTITGDVTGLTQNATYNFRLIDGDGNECPFVSFLVPGGPCEPCEITSIVVTENN